MRALLLLSFLLLSSTLHAKKGESSLEQLRVAASVVVVGTVVAVDTLLGIATLEVDRTVAGPDRSRLRYRSEPNWACDTVGAELGERTLLFLTGDVGGVMEVAHSGTGRMPLAVRDGHVVATIEAHNFAPPLDVDILQWNEGSDDAPIRVTATPLAQLLDRLARCAAGEAVCADVRGRTARHVVWGLETDFTSTAARDGLFP
ncbi:MAG TPA: hypothetical protein VGF99_02515 [Myxococcota bacterium]